MRTALACLAACLAVSCASSPPPAPAAGPSPAAPSPSDASSASAASPAPSGSEAPPSSGSAPAPAATPPPAPPTGGSVLIGEINAPKSFNPRPVLLMLQPKLLDCFNQARAARPDLHGKLTLRITINEGGQALSADADPGDHAYDPGLVQCLEAVLKAGPKFPKPGGTATVNAPMIFRR